MVACLEKAVYMARPLLREDWIPRGKTAEEKLAIFRRSLEEDNAYAEAEKCALACHICGGSGKVVK